jgi:hypothetical protein
MKTDHLIMESRAELLYNEYCMCVGGKSFDGKPLPSWEEFRADPTKQKQSDAWYMVALRAGAMLGQEIAKICYPKDI